MIENSEGSLIYRQRSLTGCDFDVNARNGELVMNCLD